MNNEFISRLTEALKDQKDIFGDEIMQRDFPERINISVHHTTPQIENTSPNQTIITEDYSVYNSLDDLEQHISGCTNCKLGKTRKNLVFGVGSHNASLMLIGEGPGADEDEKGEPFVGQAGQLLNKILAAIKLNREEVYIANVVKCRPPGNRNPLPSEMQMCMPYLLRQIEIIRPRLILCLGLVAAEALLMKKQSLSSMRGNVYDMYNAKVMVTYHPAALLRNPQWKRGCWEDVQKLRKLYDEIVS